MIRYEKIGAVIRKATPAEKPSRFTPEQIEKLKSAGNVALAILLGSGVVALSAVAPNMFIAIEKLFLSKYPNRHLSKKEKDIKMSQAFYYLKRSGYIIMRPTARDFKIYVTKLGKRKWKKLEIETLTIPHPRSWNGTWWLVAADIPTKKHKRGADLLRQKLKDLQFFPLQRTLWIYPYDPRAEIEFISNYYGIGRFVTVMEINRLDLDDQEKIRDYFQEVELLK